MNQHERTAARSRRWRVVDSGKNEPDRFRIQTDSPFPGLPVTIATVGYRPHAHIMAAAPKLLKALDNLVNEVIDGKPISGYALIKANEAIREAEGRS
jgi:hypothetical protein